MFLIRFAVIAVFVIMLMPRDPGATGGQDRQANGENLPFCGRYPKTCDASGELFEAFKQKLAYTIALIRRAIAAQSGDPRYSSSDDGRNKASGNLDDWPRNSRGPSERSSATSGDGEWRRDRY